MVTDPTQGIDYNCRTGLRQRLARARDQGLNGVGRHFAAKFGESDFDAQCGQVFANIAAALKSQGASFGNVVEFTTYLVHSQDIPAFMAFRLREFPHMFPSGKYPPNTLLIIDRLVQEGFLVEVHTVADLVRMIERANIKA